MEYDDDQTRSDKLRICMNHFKLGLHSKMFGCQLMNLFLSGPLLLATRVWPVDGTADKTSD
jgi:hypothetical protein